jgi:cytochrome c-type biogenesis protein CcmH/NrfG
MDYKKAVPALKKAYELDSSKCSILFEIATTYEELQNSKSLALRYYEVFLKAVNKDDPEYRKLRLYALARKKEIKEELTTKTKIPKQNE